MKMKLLLLSIIECLIATTSRGFASGNGEKLYAEFLH